ncbi:hypothetical protein FKB33_05860 [Enterococcus faecium]|nr:hypothetical protein [Enterococcus faecium]
MIYYPVYSDVGRNQRNSDYFNATRYTYCSKELFGNGNDLGLQIEYAVQESPDGLAQAFIIGEEFIGDDSVCLVLGDNIYYGGGLSKLLQRAAFKDTGATVFGYHVNDPERFGVVEFDENMQALSIEEKPVSAKIKLRCNWPLFLYDNEVISIAKGIKPSERGELEITDVNKDIWIKGKISVELMGRFEHLIQKHMNHCLKHLPLSKQLKNVRT